MARPRGPPLFACRRCASLRGAAALALLATAFLANVAASARAEWRVLVRAPTYQQKWMRSERARMRELRRLLAELPRDLVGASLAHVPRGLQVAWAGQLWSAAGPAVRLRPGGQPLREIRIFRHGERFVALTWDDVAVIGDAVSGRILHELSHWSDAAHARSAAHVRPFPRGDRVLTLHRKCVVIWDVGSGRVLHRLDADSAISDVAVFADGDALAVSTLDARVTIWQAPFGKRRFVATVSPSGGNASPVYLRASPRADLLLAHVVGGGAMLFNASLFNASSRGVQTLPGYATAVVFAAVNSKGNAVAMLLGRRLQLWHVQPGLVVRGPSALIVSELRRVRGLEFFPEGDRLLFFGDSGAYVWDPHSPWGFARRVSFGQVHAAAISDDGRLLAACSGRVAAVWAISHGSHGRALQRLRSRLPPLPHMGRDPEACDIDIGPDLRVYGGWSSRARQWASR